jgi:hypothetical protein
VTDGGVVALLFELATRPAQSRTATITEKTIEVRTNVRGLRLELFIGFLSRKKSGNGPRIGLFGKPGEAIALK